MCTLDYPKLNILRNLQKIYNGQKLTSWRDMMTRVVCKPKKKEEIKFKNHKLRSYLCIHHRHTFFLTLKSYIWNVFTTKTLVQQ